MMLRGARRTLYLHRWIVYTRPVLSEKIHSIILDRFREVRL